MTLSPDDIGQFFSGYAGAFNRALSGASDLQSIADHFTACFIESRANSVMCTQNGDVFVSTLEKGYAYYRSIGTREMSITGVDSYPICGDHSVATVHWRGVCRTKEDRDVTVDFDVHYLLKGDRDGMKIFGFIADDEQSALKRAGLV